MILLISTVLTLCVEMPFQNLKRLIFNKEKVKRIKGMRRKDAKVG